MALLRVETEDGIEILLPGGSRLKETEDPKDLLDAVVALLRVSNKRAPARPKSLAIQRAEEASHWLLALAEGRAR